jgi:outer membrane protein with beta-barrel domain
MVRAAARWLRGIVVGAALALALGLAPAAAPAATSQLRTWGGVTLGYGSLTRSSDDERRTRDDTFAAGFLFGLVLNPALRLGVGFNGWLLEDFQFGDVRHGVRVSQEFVVAQVYPWERRGYFARGGFGRAVYTNNHPGVYGSRGWGATIGVGREYRIANRFSVSPVVSASAGTLGNVRNPVAPVRNRRYHAFDLALGVTYP